MRLIDTKKFAIISKHHIPEVIEDAWEEGYCECLKVLDMTPTVEAIPIWWLDSYCTDCDIGLRDNSSEAIKKLFKDWKEEDYGKE